MKKIRTVRPGLARWAVVPLRLIVGYGFMQHGYAKLARGPGQFAGVLHTLGVPAPELSARVTIAVELLGGLAVLAGVLVPLVSVPLAAILLVAMCKVHLAYGFNSVKLLAVTDAGPQFGRPGYEVTLLYLGCLAAIVLGGSGPCSVDGVLARRRTGA
jgi:putative oxidoreductase